MLGGSPTRFTLRRRRPSSVTRCSAGEKNGETTPVGRIVCRCLSIGERTIGEAIASGCRRVSELGKVLKCATHCGSCIPELKALLAEEQIRA
ncbi:bacterioferritin-associated ferredoxin [Raoultella planticola]|uniref:(2Fe-2S)-binding protein n=1 Tax=Raoultella planticola TaxID=575 RepID=UPI003DA7ED6B